MVAQYRALDCQLRGRWFNPTSRRSKLRSPHICLCLSEETLKAGGPFYLVSMPGEVKDPTQGGKCVTCSGLTNAREKDNSCISLNLGCLM